MRTPVLVIIVFHVRSCLGINHDLFYGLHYACQRTVFSITGHFRG